MLYRNTKVKVHSAVRDTDFFDIVAGVLQGHSLATYLFTVSLLSFSTTFFRTSIALIKGNGLTLKRQETDDISQKPLRTQTYTDDLALHVNTLTKPNLGCLASSRQQETLAST